MKRRGTRWSGGGGGGGGGDVNSVFGRIAAVVALLGDYSASLITNDSGVPGATVDEALDNLEAEIVAIPIFPVAAATTGNVALTGAQAVDGFGPINGDLLLVWQQTNPNENGVYSYNSAGAWPRESRWNSVAEFSSYQGRSFLIKNGTLYAEQIAELTLAPTSLGSTPIHFKVTSVASEITNDSSVVGATVKAALNTLGAAIAGLVTGVSSVFGRAGAVVAAAGDYAASLVTNDSSVTGSTVKDALNALLAAIPSVPVSSVFGRTGAVAAANNDYTAAKIDWSAINNGTTLLVIGGTVVGLGSTIATVAATGSRDPGTDKVCEIILSDPVNTNKTLTLTDAAGKANGFTCSFFVQQSSGTGRWSFANSVPTTLFTIPDAGAWALDFVWNGSAWGTPTYKPIQNF